MPRQQDHRDRKIAVQAVRGVYEGLARHFHNASRVRVAMLEEVRVFETAQQLRDLLDEFEKKENN